MKSFKPGVVVLWLLYIQTTTTFATKTHSDLTRSAPIDLNNQCSMTLFSERNFEGKSVVINWAKSSLNHNEQSLKTEGACCWEIYRRRNYQGHSRVIQGNQDLNSNRLWYWRPGQIKSVKQIASCPDVPVTPSTTIRTNSTTARTTFVHSTVKTAVMASNRGTPRLRCWQCHPSGGRNCSDINKAVLTECMGGEEFCLKTVLSGEVTRDCYKAEEPDDREVGCRTIGDTTSCYCDSHGCNGANMKHSTWCTMVLLMIALGARSTA